MHKKEAVILINNTYGYKLKEEDIELYNSRYVTNYLINRETDVIYKMKNKDVIFLIEHQSKVDYSMPRRIMEYQAEIIRQVMQNTNGEKKEVPLVKAIVVYTGKAKWKVAQTIEETQVKLQENEENRIGSYKLIEINTLTEEEKLNRKGVLLKVAMLDMVENKEEFKEVNEKIVKTKLTKEEKKILKEFMIKIVENMIEKTRDKQEINQIRGMLEKYLEGGEKNMLADTLVKEMRKERKEGKREGKRTVAKEMIRSQVNISNIMKWTKLTKKEIEELKKEI